MTDVLQKAAGVLSRLDGKRAAIGVSGGRDSMCLLRAVIEYGVPREDITVVHVNHCLRETAERDEAFVRAQAEKYGVAFAAIRVDVRGECERGGMSVEQAARKLRYAAFFDIVKSGAADVILTAHHALDNVESVLMHLFRGSGLSGLCGMEAEDADRRLLRPFLDVFPEELDGYAESRGIDYVTDESNFDLRYDRNYMRHALLPAIEERYAGARRAVKALMSEVREVNALLDTLPNGALIGFDRGAVTVAEEALKGALATRYLRKAVQYFSLTDVTREQLRSAAELVNKRTGATAELANGVKAVREYDGIALYLPQPDCKTCVPISLGANYIDGMVVDVAESDASPRDAAGCAVDLDALDGAVLRFRREGDTFTPFGGKEKKLTRFFIDGKIPARVRDRTPLVCKGEKVLVVVGVQIADSVKQTPETTRRGTVTLRR